MSQYMTVEEFLDGFREGIGDTSCEIPDTQLIAHLNKALPRLAREKGLDKLFRYHDTFEIASIDKKGMPVAAWDLNAKAEDGSCISTILDIQKLRVLDATGCTVINSTPCYTRLEDFLDCNIVPESAGVGDPSQFTIEQLGGKTKIIFDRPISGPHMIDMYYSAFHPRLRKKTDLIRTPIGYIDILQDLVEALYFMESADFASSLALLENYDKEVDRAREVLAKNPSGLPFRKVARSW